MIRKRKREGSIETQLEDSPEVPEQQEVSIRDTEPPIPTVAPEPSIYPHTAPFIDATQPLTASNLRRLDKSTTTSNMGGEGSGRKPGSNSTKRPRTESLSHPEHDDGSSKSAKANTIDIRDTLEQYNFFIDDHEARKNHPKVIEEAKEVIDSARGSAMGDDEQKRLVEKIGENELTNEDTFIDILWKKLLKDTRMVPTIETSREDLEDDDWMSRDWDLDFLLHHRNKLFRTGCLPVLRTDNELVRELIETLPRLTVPKPDLLYGVNKKGFTSEEHSVNKMYPMFTDLSQTRYHPFFIVEFKSHNGSFGDAMNQACRTGGALVSGLRGLDDRTPRKNIKKGVDDRTWCFSMALDTMGARLFVNWAYVLNNGTPIYHMHELASYRLNRGEDLAEMKKHIGNVLEWGLGERLEVIKEMLQDIWKARS